MDLGEAEKGELYIFGEAILWSFFPIVTILSYSGFSPMLSLAWSTLFAGIFFGLAVLVRGKRKEIFNPEIFKHIFIIAFFIGWLFYGLYFFGLKFTTSGNAGIIAEMELFFTYLLFNVWKKQAFPLIQGFGAVLMLVGVAIILYPKNGLSFHGGDWLVLAASACAPMGNYYQQKLRKVVSSETILFWRSLLTFPFFFLLAYVLKSDASWAFHSRVFWLLLLNGAVVLGLSKIMWLEGIHRISVTKANALAAIAPLCTLFFAWLILHQKPGLSQILALIPMAAGLILLTKKAALKVSEPLL